MDQTLIQQRQARRRSHIFNLIRENNEQVSRFELCKLTRYSATTVISIVDSLIQDGLVVESACKENRVGRRPSLLQINSGSIYFLGIECSASGVNLTVINAMQEQVLHRFQPLDQPQAQDILAAMQKMLDGFAAESPEIWARIPLLVFSIPGKLDESAGLAIQYRTVPDWDRLDLRARFAYLGKKLLFLNNVDAMLAGYRLQYQLPPERSILFVIIRNSAGARLFSHGVPLSRFGVVCEVGHMQAAGSTRRCACGKKGCYDAELSLPAVVSKLREACYAGLLPSAGLDPANLTIDDFLRLVKAKNPAACDIFAEVTDYMASMLETLFSFFRPDVTVLSTYLNDCQQQLSDRIGSHLARWDPQFQPNLQFFPPAHALASFGAAAAGYEDFFPSAPPEP